MCGITGIYHLDGKTVSREAVQRATKVLAHRGPDDEGYVFIDTRDNVYKTASGKDTPDAVRMSRFLYSPGQEIQSISAGAANINLAFGYRRLSIVDLSAAGHQPMCNSNGSLWIVYNGEIYNHVELREELKRRGRTFISQSDTEVILQAYEEWGCDCQGKFNGMWAFAIWDSRRRELFCSRDRFGVKPFYYYWDETSFVFASEIKALLQVPFINISPDDRAIYNYLVLGRSEGGADTFFRNIKQLEPGHQLTVNDKGLQVNRYYSLAYTTELGAFDQKSLQDFAYRFNELFNDAVRIRLRSDVPVGSCLSGGLDSSTIVCTINKLIEMDGRSRKIIGEHQKTLSACYELDACDERQFIHEIIGATDVDAHYVFPSGDRFWQEIDDVIWHQEEPFGSTSVYAQWNVMRLARENRVPVLLDGQGADEMLAGYHTYFNAYLAQLLYAGRLREYRREFNSIRRMTQNPVFSALSFLLPLYNALPNAVRARLLAGVIKGSILNVQNTGLINNAFLTKYGVEEQSKLETNLQTALWKSEVEYGLKELLRYEDRNSMAFSVETRTPFVDYRLVEFAFSLPACYKIHDGWTKYILRISTEGLLPDKIRWRKDKLGFPTPEVAWMLQNGDRVRAIFAASDFRASAYIDNVRILRDFDSLLSTGSANGWSPLWKPLNLELWLRRMFP